MEWLSENPLDTYAKVTYHDHRVQIECNDIIGVTLKKVMQLCNVQLPQITDRRPSIIYYLRGTTKKADYSAMLIGFLYGSLPKQLYEVVHSISFWNQEGRELYGINGRSGENFADFILRCMAADCQGFTAPLKSILVSGLTESMVYIATLAGDHVLEFYFLN
jgi:hypothetical protein